MADTDDTTDDKQERHVLTNDVLALLILVGYHGVLAAAILGNVGTELLTLLVGIEITAVGTVLYWAFGKDALGGGKAVDNG